MRPPNLSPLVRVPALLFLLATTVLTSCSSSGEGSGATDDTARVTALAALNASAGEQGLEVEFEEAWVTAGGHSFHYVTSGEGKLLLFYHGFPGFWYVWKEQLLHFAKDYRVVAIDGLGANRSDKPENLDAYTVEQLAAQLHELGNTLSPDNPYTLIAHDWGGALAWAYAQQYPGDLEKLAVLNAPPYNLFLDLLANNPSQRAASTYVERLKAWGSSGELGEAAATRMWQGAYRPHVEKGHFSAADGDIYLEGLSQPGAIAGGIRWYQANIPSPDDIDEASYWPARDGRVNTESLLIWGESDRTFVSEFLDAMPEYAPRLHIEVLPSVGHSPNIEAPDQVNNILRDFIQ